MKGDRETFPARLADGTGATAELLRKVEKQPPHAPPEAAAWERTLIRLGRNAGHSRLRLVAAASIGALAGAVVLFMALSPRAPLTRSRGKASTTGTPVAAVPAVPVSSAATGAGAATVPGTSPPAAEDLVAAEAPRIQLGRASVGLPTGRSELVGEAVVALSRGGSARAFTTTAAATVELAAGEVELHVDKRPAAADHAFEVTAGAFRFTVLGTVFRVSKTNDDVTLSVSEGRVAVSHSDASRANAPLTVVTGGGFWSGNGARAASPPAATRGPSPSPALRTSQRHLFVAEAHHPRLALTGAVAPVIPSAAETPSVPAVEPAPFLSPAPVKALSAPRAPTTTSLPLRTVPQTKAQPASVGCADRANPRARIDCLLNEARGSDLRAQVALYEAARLYRDALGDVGRAITTLRELRQRFPGGALSAEAELSLAELLPRVGKYREALEVSAATLASRPGRDRADQLHLLRGDLLRAGLGDCAAASLEYAAADGARHESVADPAAFGHALCLEKLGRATEARVAFERYLTRPNARHASEATRHVHELARP